LPLVELEFEGLVNKIGYLAGCKMILTGFFNFLGRAISQFSLAFSCHRFFSLGAKWF